MVLTGFQYHVRWFRRCRLSLFHVSCNWNMSSQFVLQQELTDLFLPHRLYSIHHFHPHLGLNALLWLNAVSNTELLPNEVGLGFSIFSINLLVVNGSVILCFRCSCASFNCSIKLLGFPPSGINDDIRDDDDEDGAGVGVDDGAGEVWYWCRCWCWCCWD